MWSDQAFRLVGSERVNGQWFDLGAAQRARKNEPKQPGIGQRLKQRPGQLAVPFNLISVRANKGCEPPRNVERRLNICVSNSQLLAPWRSPSDELGT